MKHKQNYQPFKVDKNFRKHFAKVISESYQVRGKYVIGKMEVIVYLPKALYQLLDWEKLTEFAHSRGMDINPNFKGEYYLTVTVKKVAECMDIDVFDEKLGKQIANAKCWKEVCTKTIKFIRSLYKYHTELNQSLDDYTNVLMKRINRENHFINSK